MAGAAACRLCSGSLAARLAGCSGPGGCCKSLGVTGGGGTQRTAPTCNYVSALCVAFSSHVPLDCESFLLASLCYAFGQQSSLCLLSRLHDPRFL